MYMISFIQISKTGYLFMMSQIRTLVILDGMLVTGRWHKWGFLEKSVSLFGCCCMICSYGEKYIEHMIVYLLNLWCISTMCLLKIRNNEFYKHILIDSNSYNSNISLLLTPSPSPYNVHFPQITSSRFFQLMILILTFIALTCLIALPNIS